MEYQVSFGELGRPRPPTKPGTKFRLALLGDFSGRANAGRLETGAALAGRRPIRVDVDNLDAVLARQQLSLALPLAGEGGTVTVALDEMDAFHPDQLVEAVELFGRLRELRRGLASKAGFERAAKDVLSWGGAAPLPPPPLSGPERRARGSAVATDRRLSDFARLIGRPAAPAADASVDALLRRVVGPFVVPARDARQEQLTARVDEALTATMRRLLHHPDFQAAEALWRGVEFLVRRIETGARTEIVLYDVSAEELAADLAAGEALERSGLYGMLVEQPALDAQQGPLAAVLGLYQFALTPPHAELLGRVAQIAAAAGAPFVAGIGPDALAIPPHEQHPLIREAFAALQALPAAAYLGLAAPRFLLRLPYGKKTDPIDAFAFEEFSRQEGLAGMLWGHPALLPGLLLAASWTQQGAKMQLGSVLSAGEMPYYVYTDTDGEPVALPCTERLYTERQAVQVAGYRVMPLLSLRGRPEVRLGGFTSLAGTKLAGFWAPVALQPAPVAAAPAPPPAAPPPAAAPPSAAPKPAAAAAPAEAAGEDLDALLASLTPEAAAPPEAAAAPAEAEDDLDKLLASLNAPAAPPAPDATEPDLDALLASLK
jgi:type VI secretion system protein ImpC